MRFDFDKLINRENTDSVKYDMRKEYFGETDLLPMWVADMDFPVSEEISKVIIQRAMHPVYGYSFRNEAYYNAIVNWLNKRHQWKIKADWIRFSPGIVTAVNMAIQTFSKPGDGVIVQPPVYFPFFNAIKNNGRRMIENELINNNGHYEIDFNLLEKQAKEAKILLLSSPHNPVSRCWTKEELTAMGEICLKNQVLIVSDEIHNDLILPGFHHTPIAALSSDLLANTVTFIAPSKTFNLAGFFTSSVIISNDRLRSAFDKTLKALHLIHGNLFGTIASTAGYQHAAPWLDALMVYIKGNFDYFMQFIDEKLPMLKMSPPEATYLAWVDFRETGYTDDALNELLIKKAKVGFSRGSTFGTGGEGFMRINMGTQRARVVEMSERLLKVF